MCLPDGSGDVIRKPSLSRSLCLSGSHGAFDVTAVVTNALPLGVILCVWCSEASATGAPRSG